MKTINLTPEAFICLAKKDSSCTERKIISFISIQKSRAKKGEISSGTASNALKAIRLFLEMNDVSLNWKKTRRVIPRARYALDRIPTVKEIKEIVESADLRGKALPLVLLQAEPEKDL